MWTQSLQKDKSIIVDLFTGQLISSLKCRECLNVSFNFELFTCIQLPIRIDDRIMFSIIGTFLLKNLF